MHQLIYISSAALNVTSTDIDSILAISRLNNAHDDLTGLLIYDGRRFLQALEGPGTAVDKAYERIKLDTRHRASVKLSLREVWSRQFGSWEMASQKVDLIADDDSLGVLVAKMVAQVPDPNTRALFSEFAKIKRKAA